MSLIACGSIHEGHEWLSNYSQGRQEIFTCLAGLVHVCEQFCWCQDIDKVLLHKTFFLSQCIQQQ